MLDLGAVEILEVLEDMGLLEVLKQVVEACRREHDVL